MRILRWTLVAFSTLAVAWVAMGGGASAAEKAPGTSSDRVTQDDRVDHFDFFAGTWEVTNYLPKGDEIVESGTATDRVDFVAGGNGLLDQWSGEFGSSTLHGYSLRAYDKAAKEWVIVSSWPNGRPRETHTMAGNFKDGIGQFSEPGRDTFMAQFSNVTQDTFQWSQLRKRSVGGYGVSWLMKYKRVGGPKALNATTAQAVMPLPEIAEKYPVWRAFDTVLGTWSGTAKLSREGVTHVGKAKMVGTTMVQGLGLLALIDVEWDNGETVEHAWLIHHSARRDNWMVMRLDSTDSTLYRAFGDFDGKRGEFIERTKDEKQSAKLEWSVDSEDMSIQRLGSHDDGKNWSPELSISLSRKK